MDINDLFDKIINGSSGCNKQARVLSKQTIGSVNTERRTRFPIIDDHDDL